MATLILSGCGYVSNIDNSNNNPTPTPAINNNMDTIKVDGLTWNTGDIPMMTYDEALAFCTENGMQLQEQNALLLNIISSKDLQNPEGAYWTSGESMIDDNEAYVVNFENRGMVGVSTKPKSEKHYVRCFKR